MSQHSLQKRGQFLETSPTIFRRSANRASRLETVTLLTSDPTWLFLSLIPTGIGFVLFVYGKKQERWPQLAAGLLLMVYPYFATGTVALVAIGAVIGFVLWIAIRLGW